jgi:hypothetical protein
LLKANPLMKEAIEDNVDDPRYFVLSEVNSVDS